MPTQSTPISVVTPPDARHGFVGSFVEPKTTDSEQENRESEASGNTLTQDDVEPDNQPRQRKHRGLFHRAKKGPEMDDGNGSGSIGEKKPRPKLTIGHQIKSVLFPQWMTVNWLLVLVPVGIALNYVGNVSGVVIFVVNFLAIIPLAGVLSYATEELALRVGETLGGLLNATFGLVTSRVGLRLRLTT